MYLVYLTSHLDVSSVKQWLYITGRNDALIIDDVDDLFNEILIDSYDLVIFDYKMDLELIDTLRTLEGKYESIQVFVANSKIGEAYLSVTENISVLPKSLNLMVYLWQHPAFSLGNIINAEEAGKDVFSISDFADIDTESEVLEFKTTIEDLGDSDLAEIELLKVEKQAIAIAEEEESEESTTDIFDELGFEAQILTGLIKRDKVAPVLDAALQEITEEVAAAEEVPAVEETTEEVSAIEETTEDIPVVEEPTEDIPTVEETTEETEVSSVEETTEDIPTVEETESLPAIEETSIFTDTEPTVAEETTEITEPIEETVEPVAEVSMPTEEITEPVAEISTAIEETVEPTSVEEQPVIEKIETVYEEYSEENKDKYDEVIVSEKAITENTVVDADYENDMAKMLHNTDETGIVGKSDLGDTAVEYRVKPEDLKLFEEEQSKIMQEISEKQEKPAVEEKPVKREPRVLKGSQTYVPPTQTITKHVGIKTVEASREDITQVKRGTLAGLRKRSMRTYRNSYEYFKDKNYAIDKLDEIYNYVQTENLKGSSLLLEEELYNRGCINDDIFITFMKEYLHRQVLTLPELMQADVILDTWDEDTCRKLRLLEIPSHQTDGKCVVISNSVKAIQNSLLSKYEKLELYVTLDHYIDIRLGDKEE